MTYDLFAYHASDSGRLLGYIGLIASLLQGALVRRMHPLRVVQLGVLSCAAAFFILGQLETERGLYAAATLLAVTSSTVVTGLNSLSSFEAGSEERGEKLGNHRSFGQFGRALGPLLFCTMYWWAGRGVAYAVGGAGMIGVVGLVFGGLKPPKGLAKLGSKSAAVVASELALVPGRVALLFPAFLGFSGDRQGCILHAMWIDAGRSSPLHGRWASCALQDDNVV
ncbi:hypothetical protein LTS01_024890 [Friedmanniomyces endolithicus]|nr:hypothetical protein LTS01_024890 [Friedmanniomyces endolithicus]